MVVFQVNKKNINKYKDSWSIFTFHILKPGRVPRLRYFKPGNHSSELENETESAFISKNSIRKIPTLILKAVQQKQRF
jgi:hypothetical protein